MEDNETSTSTLIKNSEELETISDIVSNSSIDNEFKEEMKKDYSYPKQSDSDIQYKLFKKREFYSNKINKPQKMKSYDDIKKYRNNKCKRTIFTLHEHQLMISNFINPNTPYRGLILFHGLGTGKCTSKYTIINVNNRKLTQEKIWDIFHTNVFIDEENGQWSTPYEELFIESFNGSNIVLKKIRRLYRELYFGKLNVIILENGKFIEITKKHKLLTDNDFTNNLYKGLYVWFYSEKKIKKCKIKEILEINYSDFIYDLEIDEIHNYIGNSFICHNTCVAINVAEKFKLLVQKYNVKIHILVPGPLLKEIWKNSIITCTGDTYTRNIDKTLITKDNEEKLMRAAYSEIQQFYRFMSYKGFYRRVIGEKIVDKKIDIGKKVVYRKTDEGEYERDISADRIYSLNNTLLIIDEAHNLTGTTNAYGDAVRKIMKSSVNLKILLLTATPMKNLADDIIDLLNFVRPINQPIVRNEVFENEGHLLKIKEGGIEYFKKMSIGYFSHVRGGDPLVYAKRVDRGIIPNGLIFTKITPCIMEQFQKETYDEAIKTIEDALDRKSQAVSNFTFPILNDKKTNITGGFGKVGLITLRNQIQSYHKIINKKICEFLKIKERHDMVYMAENEKTINGLIFHKNYLKYFSVKFYRALLKINKLFYGKKKAKTAFIYSNLVKIGIELFGQVLLQNGYLEYQENESNYKINDDTKCYFCGFPHITHSKISNDIPKHAYSPATFFVITGKTEDNAEYIPEEKKKLLDKIFNNIHNADGRYIKFILGSKIMNEGISLMNIGEVHILDVYFNFGRVDQVIGRAIRWCSHIELMNEQNIYPEVNVYKYAIVTKNELSTEIDLYRKAEQKYILVKKMERIIKEIAIDCPLNVYGNMFKDEIEKNKDCKDEKDCPQSCDFTKCYYKCDNKILNFEYYDSERKIYKKLTKNLLDYSTYTHGLAMNEINFAKSRIKDMFLFKSVFTLQEIVNYVMKNMDENKRELFDVFFVYKALDDLIPITENDFVNYSDTFLNKFNETGYIIYVGKYYIFQPFNQNEDVPMYYRTTYNKEIKNKLSLYNYLKHFGYKKQKNINEEHESEILKEKCKYDFESVMDYYENRDENDYIGIVDCELKGTKTIDVFKVREKRSKIIDKKRGTGIPSLKGAVCNIAKDKKYLNNLIKLFDIKITKKDNNRKSLCEKIKETMLDLEKYSTNNKTYVMVPANHNIYPFPYNLLDRLHFIQQSLNESTYETKKNQKNKIYYILTTNKLSDDLIKKYNASKENNKWKIIIE